MNLTFLPILPISTGQPKSAYFHRMGQAMRGNYGRARVLVNVGVAVFMAGCSALGLQSPTSSRSNNQLTKDAKELREEAPVPAAVPRELNKTLLPTYIVEPGDVLLVQPVDLDSPIRLPGD